MRRRRRCRPWRAARGRSSSVQAPAIDVPPHLVGHKVAQGEPASGPRAQLARADVEAGRVEHDRADRAVEVGRAGTTRDEDRRELADAIGRLPARKIGERVAAEDEVQITFLAQSLERVDGERRSVPIELDSRDGKTRLRLRSRDEHRVAIVRAGDRFAILQRRAARRHEDDPVELRAVECGLGDREVADVHRIERAAEDADLHSRSFHSSSSLPIFTVSPSLTPSSRSRFSTPLRWSMRWKYADASPLSQSIPEARRSMRSPRTRNASPSRSTRTSRALPLNTMRRSSGAACGATRGGVSTKRRLLRRSTPSPVAAESASASRPRASSALTSSGTWSRASTRSILLSAMISGRSRRPCPYASSSASIVAMSARGSSFDASPTCTTTRVRSMCRRNSSPRPPRATTISAPSATRSAISSFVATSRIVVPAGTPTTRSRPALPLRFPPSPAAPSVARYSFLNWKSPSDASCASARSTRSPPLPPSPPSGPPRGTCASRRNEITPRPPSPPRTLMRARSRNMRDLGERTDECTDPDVRQRVTESRECGAHAARTFAVVRDHRERAQRVGVEVAKHERRALRRIGRERDERLDLVAAIEEAGQHEHLYREREPQL